MKIKNLLAIFVLAAFVLLIFKENRERANRLPDFEIARIDFLLRDGGANAVEGFLPPLSQWADGDYFEYTTIFDAGDASPSY